MAGERTIPQPAKGSTVTFTVKSNGQAVPKTMEVSGFTVVREVNRIPWAQVTLIDGDAATEDFKASNADFFVPGQELELWAGYGATEDLVFKGLVVKHAVAIRNNGKSILKLECRDKAFRMTLGKHSHYYRNIKDSGVALDLSRKHGLDSSVEDTKITHAELVQYDTSDWDFLLSRIDIRGQVLVLEDGKLRTLSPTFTASPVLSLRYGATILEFDAEMDARNQYAGVQAQSWDYANQELSEVKAKEPSSIREAGNFSSAKLAEVTGLGQEVLRHPGHLEQEDLQGWADACWQRSRLAKIRGRVKFEGFARVRPCDLLEIQGVGNRFSGKVWVAGVRHEVGAGGWTTDVQFGLDPQWQSAQWPPAMPSVQSMIPLIRGLHTGRVTQLENDPEGEDRIQVSLPHVNSGDEGAWARMGCFIAGDQAGSFFRPEIGDEVIVGFIADDPGQAVILGILNSSNRPAPVKASNDNFEKGIYFSKKMKMIFHEEDQRMQFETPGGNVFIISDKDKGISMKDQNGNKLVMNQDGIVLESAKKLVLKAATGDVEVEGMNLKQKASVQFKAEGSAGLEVSSSAIAIIKGSMVQIN